MPRDHPVILAFDTSAAHCAAALLSGDRVLAERIQPMQKGQAERLMPMLEEMLLKTGVGWSDMSAIGVGIGPGNFTGIRIAVAAARGLALALGVPAIGVSTFDALATGAGGVVVASVAAPRNFLYIQIIGGPDATAAPVHCDPGSLPAIPGHTKPGVIGHRAGDIARRCSGRAGKAAHTLPVAIAHLAAKRRTDATARPAPLYIRAAVAAAPRDPAPVMLD